jgi:hypothetical protein
MSNTEIICKCGKKITGINKKQADYLLAQHKLAKHMDFNKAN